MSGDDTQTCSVFPLLRKCKCDQGCLVSVKSMRITMVITTWKNGLLPHKVIVASRLNDIVPIFHFAQLCHLSTWEKIDGKQSTRLTESGSLETSSGVAYSVKRGRRRVQKSEQAFGSFGRRWVYHHGRGWRLNTALVPMIRPKLNC